MNPTCGTHLIRYDQIPIFLFIKFNHNTIVPRVDPSQKSVRYKHTEKWVVPDRLISFVFEENLIKSSLKLDESPHHK